MVSETTNLGGDWDNLGGGKQIPTKNSLVGGSDLGGGTDFELVGKSRSPPTFVGGRK